MSLAVDVDMTEASMEHPTAGRRRRHKSPPTLHAHIAISADEDGEKEGKRLEIRAYHSYLNIQQAPLRIRPGDGDHSDRFWGN